VDNQAFVPEPTIMIVEDDHDLGIVLKTAIEERLHLRTLVASDGLQAVSMAKEEHPNLILMDLNMPYVNGFEAIRHIKDDPAICGIPIVAFSNHNWDFHWKNKALALGCEACVNKTMSLEELDALVLKFVQIPEASTQIKPRGVTEKTASLSYYWDDWSRITDHLNRIDLDFAAENELPPSYHLASMIERESDFWDDPDVPQTVWMEPWQQEQLRNVAQQLRIEEAPTDTP
jgi:CheY-like chemotaxis protein